MLLRARSIILAVFFASIAVVFVSKPVSFDRTYIIALLFYWLFSSLYSHLRVVDKTKNNIPVDYGINYSLSFALFAGPLGLFIFETLFRLTEHLTKKYLKTAEPDEWLHTLYNIGSFVTFNSLAFALYNLLHPLFEPVPFIGFWLLIFLLVVIVSFLTDCCLIVIFYITGDIRTQREALDFIKTRSWTDMGKTALTNGLLFLFLQEQQWDMLLSLFLLNYFVSRSFFSKSQSIQHKLERDQFEKMAYTDFLTGVHNRAYMDKTIAKLNETGEWIGVVVADIDNFKAINDTYNHAVGDEVIRHFALTLKRFLKEDDFLFRSGGEEFTMFLRHRTFEESVELVEEMRETVRHSTVLVDDGAAKRPIAYTSSFGLYFFQTGGTISIEKAYVYADHLLLRSKESGKNKISAQCGGVA
ncbi:diguanylate cyclase [Geobacillus subterraneus]|uniref:Diguanylate cyclase n=2 Tax=Geobacillus TaxID=129337 RepID=A0ABM6AF36_9BACL|nr:MULTISPECIES: GGDEF domain-containing protein [Geobacillus]AMX84977.1 diguanylate cyclase [Geobacillus subterraneus]KZS25127.1 diguanylate cyclase [Geobacillus subterraneus]OXB85174.1 GGDEF domain-containing protein [Geobacillus uzenensis]QIZ66192.1 GGDEF domain-containing protein [Geobacillus subterraneus]WPZ18393.1 GGDEF domain-containing protein [Geobacillus subterraneus]